jgi:hypothetical protein
MPTRYFFGFPIRRIEKDTNRSFFDAYKIFFGFPIRRIEKDTNRSFFDAYKIFFGFPIHRVKFISLLVLNLQNEVIRQFGKTHLYMYIGIFNLVKHTSIYSLLRSLLRSLLFFPNIGFRSVTEFNCPSIMGKE